MNKIITFVLLLGFGAFSVGKESTDQKEKNNLSIFLTNVAKKSNPVIEKFLSYTMSSRAEMNDLVGQKVAIKNKYSSLVRTKENIREYYPSRSQDRINTIKKWERDGSERDIVNDLSELRGTAISLKRTNQEVEKIIQKLEEKLKYYRGIKKELHKTELYRLDAFTNSTRQKMGLTMNPFLRSIPRVSEERFNKEMKENSEYNRSMRRIDALQGVLESEEGRTKRILKDMKRLRREIKRELFGLPLEIALWSMELAQANFIKLCKIDTDGHFRPSSIVTPAKMINPRIIKICDPNTGECRGGVTCVDKAVVNSSSRRDDQKAIKIQQEQETTEPDAKGDILNQ